MDKMDLESRANIFKELGNSIRLSIVKELIKYGDTGMSVGELKNFLQIPASTLTHHLAALQSVNLISRKKKGTTLYCISNIALIQESAEFLIANCCINQTGNCR